MSTGWLEHFPALAGLNLAQREHLLHHCPVVNLPEGKRLFGPGQPAENFVLLLEGSIRVQQFSENGRTIVLYRISAGESCVMTTACMIGHEDYSAEAIVEAPSRAAIIPRAVFDEMLATAEPFRRFVFAGLSHRLTEIFHLVEDVAFTRLEMRLAQKLLTLAADEPALTITQQQLASELGSAREVVSRMLAEFQRRGWLKLARGQIEIKNRAALAALISEGR